MIFCDLVTRERDKILYYQHLQLWKMIKFIDSIWIYMHKGRYDDTIARI